MSAFAASVAAQAARTFTAAEDTVSYIEAEGMVAGADIQFEAREAVTHRRIVVSAARVIAHIRNADQHGVGVHETTSTDGRFVIQLINKTDKGSCYATYVQI
jgi:hypothetical protein